MTDNEKLAALEKRTRDAMRAVVLNGRRASEVVALQLAAESLSCAVMSAHRARMNAARLPRALRKSIEREHARLVKLVMRVSGELSKAIR